MSRLGRNGDGRRAVLDEGRGDDGALVYVLRLYRANGQRAVKREGTDFRALAAEAADWMDWSERRELLPVLLAVLEGARHE